MNIVIAIDSFKGSMTSMQAGNAAKEGFLRVFPSANIVVKPIADGGEGTVQALTEGLGGNLRTITVHNPLCREIAASYGIVNDTAIIEMAAASGIALIDTSELNPYKTTTYGVGEMIADAIAQGCRKFIVGIGGSATNDGGVGMLQALGYSFTDSDGKEVPHGAAGLEKIAAVHTENALPALQDCEFLVACDVKNPLCGEQGCSYIFARQKGAKPADLPILDAAVDNYATVTASAIPHADKQAAGAGAAGGLGFAFMTYLNGKLQSGIDLILENIRLEDSIKNADLVITGEGRMDSQTVMGKVPVGIAALAKKHGLPVIAFAGCVTPDANVCNTHGIDAIFPIVRKPCTLEEAMQPENAMRNMADCAEQAARLWAL